jgi:lysine-specific histone demethylase 1
VVDAATGNVLSLDAIAADASRLDPSEMSAKEVAAFGDWTITPETKTLYLKIRNGILGVWYTNCYIELTQAAAQAAAPTKLTGYSDERFVQVYRYLNHAGLINFGVFKFRPKGAPPPHQRRRKVIVIGAGVSGLAAARKLKSLGFEVVTLEGRKYVGGRVNSYKWGKYTADLGAMVITGLGGGNPLHTLCRQVNLKLYSVRGVCPIHDSTGKRIGKQLDDQLEHEFNQVHPFVRQPLCKSGFRSPSLSYPRCFFLSKVMPFRLIANALCAALFISWETH